MTGPAVSLVAVTGVPEVHTGDDVTQLLLDALAAAGQELHNGDVLVVSSKIVSKALGLTAETDDKTALVAAETEHVVAERALAARPTRIVRARSGPVMAAAGIDGSNTGGHEHWLLLPRDPDAHARELCRQLRERSGARVGVILSDTSGRAWRLGLTDFALGAAGTPVLDDLRGGVDADGRPLEVTTRAIADEVAAAADLVKGKADAVPAALVRGLPWGPTPLDAHQPGGRDLVREGRTDWFSYGRVEAVRASLGIEPGSTDALAVGLAPVRPEPRTAKVSRAARTAMHGVPDAVVDVGAEQVVLAADSPLALGRLIERFRSALWCEWLTCTEEQVHGDATQVTVRIASAYPAPEPRDRVDA